MDEASGFYALNRPRLRRIFRRISAFSLVVFIFFFSEMSGKSSSSGRIEVVRRHVMEVNANLNDSTVDAVHGSGENNLNLIKPPTFCPGIYNHQGYESQCDYLINSSQCADSGGFFNYIAFFYCDCEKNKALGYMVLVLWLVALFYLLGNTATEYFCCCLEKLSNLLNLRPTVAGVTLLPLGNGAPDVFASIAAFMGTEAGDVGLNSVLGGAMFVLSVVVGTIAICSAGNSGRISKRCFFRDVTFFLFTLVALVVILVAGEVNFGGAIAYFSIYVVYALSVAANEIIRRKGYKQDSESLVSIPLLAHADENGGVPLLGTRLPHWVWNSHVGIYTNEEGSGDASTPKAMWGWSNEETVGDGDDWFKFCWWVLELPLALPRRVTIPIVEEERWSKGYAVASAFFAPMLLATLWNSRQNSVDFFSKEVVYVMGATVGIILGVVAIIYTKREGPPTKFVFPWVLGGFFMSIVWFYIIANELVALLVGLGVIFGIKPSILGLTVLAWGNSMGDLMSNLALAMNGGDGLQMAMSGCYAGPMFNTLVGLGISMVLGAWSKIPGSYIVPKDNSLYFTIGFIALSLVWSMVALPRNGMRPGKLLGVGLITLYFTFLSVRLLTALSSMSTDGS
ncbi:cation/calcium exchanger 4-like [Impatiens glandulifera]|uniref:cation/calcium exchanger 4-like n=1 Tax=Impatiens glandulifera TaxID=253017 RepID=UPI001FB0D598|nr:cation/calcium exchanger 4-like [Impatiens glandulifera]